MSLTTIKNYLKVDFNDDDYFICELQSAAEEYLTGAGVKANYNKSLYRLAILMLISHWYENRSIVFNGSGGDVLKYSLKNIIMQLQLDDEVI